MNEPDIATAAFSRITHHASRGHHRARDRFGHPVVSLVILADASRRWRPARFEEGLLGCRVQFDFPVCKLLDVVATAQSAVDAGQPSAVVIVANWVAQQTRQDMRERHRRKWELTRRLYEAGYSRRDILELYRLIDWMLRLPAGLDKEFKQQVYNYERKKVMPYVTSSERLAKEEGRTEGEVKALQETVLDLLEVRFARVPPPLRKRVNASTDLALLKQWRRQVATCAGLAEFQRALKV